MKQIIILLFPALFMLGACEPSIGKKSMGGIIDPADIRIEAVNATPGSNAVILRVLTPGLTGQWRDVTGTRNSIVGVGTEVDVILASQGESTFSFTAVSDGGLAPPVTTRVTVSRIDVIPESWLMLAGTSNNGADGKTWVWADGDAVYGSGGYGNSVVPGWSFVAKADMQSVKNEAPTNEMVFDLRGGTNFTKRTSAGATLQTGTFEMDLTRTKGAWSVGELTITGATVLCGTPRWGGPEVHVFDIIKINDREMVLAYAPAGTAFGVWADCTLWSFKAK
jgi:hypothetical protein